MARGKNRAAVDDIQIFDPGLPEASSAVIRSCADRKGGTVQEDIRGDRVYDKQFRGFCALGRCSPRCASLSKEDLYRSRGYP